MAKCPKCGATLRWFNFRAECKECGVNIPNYNWEQRLSDDADTAETSFAKLHFKLKNFKYGTIGSPFMIVRLVLTLLPLVALVVPLVNIQLSLPFYEKTDSVSFLTFILNYMTKFDIGKTLSLMSGTALGPVITKMVLGVGFSFLAVACGVINFFAVLIASLTLSSTVNIVLNSLSTAFWALSAFFMYQFTTAAAATSFSLFSGSVSIFYIVGIAMFIANIVINVFAKKNFNSKKASQPNLEEAIKIELKELREKDSVKIAE